MLISAIIQSEGNYKKIEDPKSVNPVSFYHS